MQMNPTKSSNSGEVPIHNLFGLVERYLDLDQTDGPHRYYGWDDLVETIPRTVFNKVKIGSNNKIKNYCSYSGISYLVLFQIPIRWT